MDPVTLALAQTYTDEMAEKSGGGGNMIYSTEEKIVGTWTDGKPLYEKTILFAVSLAGGVFTTIAEIADMDEYCYGYGKLNTGVTFDHPLPGRSFDLGAEHSVSPKLIRIYNTSSSTYSATGNATVAYTKTTDEATVPLPDEAAMQTAYEEGVQSA